ncbi:MAG: hypothetical protein HRF51_01695 [bacterium]|jgi:hypothetical protein
MGSLIPLKKEVERCLRVELERIDFRRSKGSFLKTINDQTDGWLGLTPAILQQYGVVDIFPVVGVLNKPIWNLAQQWWGYEPPKGWIWPTASEPLYKLANAPESYSWQFDRIEKIPTLVKDLADRISHYGISWINRLSSAESLLEYILSHGAHGVEFTKYAIPAAYIVLNRREEARQYVQRALREIEEHEGIWSGYTVGWEKRYREIMSNI